MSLQSEIRARTGQLTAVERKIAAVLLADYPFAGLEPIQALAERSRVSAPSITRFVGKLGCAGFVDFQRRLIDELRERSRSPIDLRATQVVDPPATYLQGYAERVCTRVRESMGGIAPEIFDRVCSLLGDERRRVFIIGGRVSDALATILAIHLRLLRVDVTHIPADPELWPDALQVMKRRDVLVMFDFRRYQVLLERLAALAVEVARPEIVLVTDTWLSPIARHSTDVLPVRVDVDTAWDTEVAALTLVEAIVVRVSEENWARSRKRIETWDRLRPFPPKPAES